MMISHLLEFRKRLVKSLIFFFVAFIACFYFSTSLFQFFIHPLLYQLHGGSKLIASHVLTGFFVPLKLAFHAALLLSLPYFLYQLWLFVAPGLYLSEQRPLRLMLIQSMLLFLIGVSFCYYFVLPLLFGFVIAAIPPQVSLLPDMATSLDFIFSMLCIFGLCFQLPLISYALVRANLVTLEELKTARSYFIVAAFIVGMLLTPPDVLSQLLLAIPLCLLYELGIWLVLFATRKQEKLSTVKFDL